MFHRFESEAGKRLRLDALAAQKLVAGNRTLAEELDGRVKLRLLREFCFWIHWRL